MAATVSAWAKPSAWALDAEEHDAAVAMEKIESANSSPAAADFPSLAAAATTKVSKKKKKLSLAEFTTGQPVTHGSGAKFRPSAASEVDIDLVLPTGPRERTAEELERSSTRGFGYSSYGGGGRREESEGRGRWGAGRGLDEPRRERDGMPPPPSRADEVDDWGAGKRSAAPMMERRERSSGFFDSQSRADESDNWILNKSAVSMAATDGRRMREGYRERERRAGFEFGRDDSNIGPDAESWGRRREVFGNDGSPDGESWGKKREEVGGGARPRLVLQRRSVPMENGNGGKQVEEVVKNKGSNPFGAARPREEVLKEKGQDWKKIDEKLDEMKIRPLSREGPGFGRRSSGLANGAEDRMEYSWRKADLVVSHSPPSSEKAEEDTPDSHLPE